MPIMNCKNPEIQSHWIVDLEETFFLFSRGLEGRIYASSMPPSLPPFIPLSLSLFSAIGTYENCMARFHGPCDDKYLILIDTKMKRVRDPYLGPTCATVCSSNPQIPEAKMSCVFSLFS